jgi:hypothetical protein
MTRVRSIAAATLISAAVAGTPLLAQAPQAPPMKSVLAG